MPGLKQKHSPSPAVIAAGATSLQVRCLAEHLEQHIAYLKSVINEAMDSLVDDHGAFRMEMGEVQEALNRAAGVHAHLMTAHWKAAKVIARHNVRPPSATEIADYIAANPLPAGNEGGR